MHNSIFYSNVYIWKYVIFLLGGGEDVSMDAVRRKVINGNLIEEYYWHGDFIVYVNRYAYNGTFEEAVEAYEEQKILRKGNKHGKEK